jgi:hypothetical protein
MRRKIQQLVMDEITFVWTGAITIFAFWFLVKQTPLAVNLLCWVEWVLLAVLGYEMVVYADLAKGR